MSRHVFDEPHGVQSVTEYLPSGDRIHYYQWPLEPRLRDVEHIARRYLLLQTRGKGRCDIETTKREMFERKYIITTDSGRYTLRVMLPVDPLRVASEVATVLFVSQNTSIAVAKIIAFDSSTDNPLCFPWILAEQAEGNAAHGTWRKLSWEAKERMREQLTQLHRELFHLKFRGIGSLQLVPKVEPTGCPRDVRLIRTTLLGTVGFAILVILVALAYMVLAVPILLIRRYRPWLIPASNDPASYMPVLGRFVSFDLFNYDNPAPPGFIDGPFRDSQEWIRMRIPIYKDDLPDEHFDTALAMLPDEFPSSGEAETTVLHLDRADYKITPDGKITDVNCSFAYTAPLWEACCIPRFLNGRKVLIEPQPETYGGYVDQEDDPMAEDGVNCLYWIHLMEFDCYKLRQAFLEEMREYEPEWTREYIGRKRKNAVAGAMQYGGRFLDREYDSEPYSPCASEVSFVVRARTPDIESDSDESDDSDQTVGEDSTVCGSEYDDEYQ